MNSAPHSEHLSRGDNIEAPFKQLPQFKSTKHIREQAIAGLLPRDESGAITWPEQSMNPDDPLTLPTLVKFFHRSPLVNEKMREEIVCVLLATSARKVLKPSGKVNGHTGTKQCMYIMYYEGCNFLDHTANVGADGKVYPWSSLSTATKLFYGRASSNGWLSLRVMDRTSFYYGQPLVKVQNGQEGYGGPGFRNTIDPEVIATWQEMGAIRISGEASHSICVVRELLSHVGDPIQYPAQKRRQKKQKLENSPALEEQFDHQEDEQQQQVGPTNGEIEEEEYDGQADQEEGCEKEGGVPDIEKDEDPAEGGGRAREEENVERNLEEDAMSRLGLPRELVLGILNGDDIDLKQSMLDALAIVLTSSCE